MKPIKPFLILFLLTWYSVFSQNIFSAVHHDRKPSLRTSPNVYKIERTNTFYNSSGKEVTKEISFLNDHMKIQSENRYNQEGNLTARLTFIYDSVSDKNIGRKFERWHPLIGYSSESAEYVYDENNHLIKVIDRDMHHNIFRETFILNNEKGDPVELKVIEENRIISAIEKAVYNYENNEVTVIVIDGDGNVLSSNTTAISFEEKRLGNEYNEFGDLIKTENSEIEYRYDKHNNWTKQIIYNTKNGKRKKNSIFTRTLFYTEK